MRSTERSEAAANTALHDATQQKQPHWMQPHEAAQQRWKRRTWWQKLLRMAEKR